MTHPKESSLGSRSEALALNAREAQLLLQKLQSAEAALHDERQLSGKEREVIVERLRFAESQDEAARERLARALASLRTRAREGAAEAAAQHGHAEESVLRLREENQQLQVSHASCEARLQELREELSKSDLLKQEAAAEKNKLTEALTQLRCQRAEEAAKQVQHEQSAQLAQVTAERERLSGRVKQLQAECETRQKETVLLEATVESQRKAARYVESQSEREVRILRHEISEFSASDLQRAQADAKEKDRLTKALAEANRGRQQQAPTNLLHELKRWNQAPEETRMVQDAEQLSIEVPREVLLSELQEARTRCRALETALDRRMADQDEAQGQLPQDWDRVRLELRDEMRSWLRGEADGRHFQREDHRPGLQSPRVLQSPVRADLERRCQDLQFQLDRALEDAAAARQRALDLEWDAREAPSSPWVGQTSSLTDRQASRELEKKTVTLEAEMNAVFAQAQAAKAAEESALAALSDSERRCQDGLRRMDAMLADTKELTRELAKHKHLAKGMDDLVRRHERRMLRHEQDPVQVAPSFSEVRSRSSRRQSPTRHPVWSVQDGSTSRNDLRLDLQRTAGSVEPPSLSSSCFASRNAPSGAVMAPLHHSPPDGGGSLAGRYSLSPKPRTNEFWASERRQPPASASSMPCAGSASRWREASSRADDRRACIT